ncbi:MAG: hypothetical protein ACO3U4_10700, partial [Gemmobacter sp.]
AGYPQPMALRGHRASSGIGRAEAERADHDARFLFLWIAFNAAYADARRLDAQGRRDASKHERARIDAFFDLVVRLDASGRIYDAIWARFSGPVRVFLENPFVFRPFWDHQNGEATGAGWQAAFERDQKRLAEALANRRTAQILGTLFDRLYVLRNQIVHGGATWNGKVNRDQMRDGAAILGFLVPVFVDIMLVNPHEAWGDAFYPVIEG